MVSCHHSENFTDCSLRTDSDRVINHTVLRPFDTAHLIHLLLYRHVLVYDTDTAGTGHGYGQLSFGHSVHCGRDDRGLKRDFFSESCRDIHTSRQNLRTCRNQQNVIEGKSFGNL